MVGMTLNAPSFTTPSFFGVDDAEKFWTGFDALTGSLTNQRGVFASDNLVAFERSLGFMTDKPLIESYKQHAETIAEKGALWRLVTLTWAALQALKVGGDFIECGCYKGTTAKIISETIDFKNLEKTYYLYDLFDHDVAMSHHAMPEHSASLEQQVRARFLDTKNVRIIAGAVPDSLVEAPETIALLHLDLNNAEAEISALEVLFDRVSPGGIVILDDFGWLAYERQRSAETAWFAKRGYPILELPTGQGLVVR